VGSVNPITLILNSIVTVEAHFGSPFLEVSVRGSGTVNRSPDKSQYIAGEHVTLTAVPGRWYIFERWADGSPINPRTITIGLSNTYAAVFSPTTALERVTFNGVSRTAPIGMPAVFLDSQFILTDVVNRFASTEVTLQTTFPNGAILFTLDGTPPSLGSALYTGPFTLRSSAILRTMAYNAAFTFSAE